MGNDIGKIDQPDVPLSYADDVAAMADTNSGTVLSSSAVARWRQNETRRPRVCRRSRQNCEGLAGDRGRTARVLPLSAAENDLSMAHWTGSDATMTTDAAQTTDRSLIAEIKEAIGWVENEYGFVTGVLKKCAVEIKRLRAGMVAARALAAIAERNTSDIEAWEAAIAAVRKVEV